MSRVASSIFALLFRLVKILFFFLPRPLCLRAGRLAGSLTYLVDKKHRKIALSNLALALGSELSEPERKRIARKSFLHFGEFLAGIIKLSHLPQKRLLPLLEVKGEEHLRQALKQGRGALLYSAHYGNWEIAPLLLSRIAPLQMVARPLDFKLLEAELFKFRTSLGARVISKQKATREILRSLGKQEMVAILIDQNVLRSEAVFVDFFGKQAATTPSLALFHLRTGSPLISVFCHPASRRRFSIEIGLPVIHETTGNPRQDVLKITQLCTKIIEAQIRKKPESWLWFHNRWKTRPEDESLKFMNLAKTQRMKNESR